MHFSFTIMRGKNGRYDNLNFPCEEIGVERKLLIDHNHVSHIRIGTKTPCLHCLITVAGDSISPPVTGFLTLMKSTNPNALGERTLVLGNRSELNPICLLTDFITF